jgi:hypothetical protein
MFAAQTPLVAPATAAITPAVMPFRGPTRNPQAAIIGKGIGPYEYDEYYNTRVNRRWARTKRSIIVGALLIIFGIACIVFTAIDIGAGAASAPFFQNPNYRRVNRPNDESANLAATWHEHSIWPTLGKGIWVGLIVSHVLRLT